MAEHNGPITAREFHTGLETLRKELQSDIRRLGDRQVEILALIREIQHNSKNNSDRIKELEEDVENLSSRDKIFAFVSAVIASAIGLAR